MALSWAYTPTPVGPVFGGGPFPAAPYSVAVDGYGDLFVQAFDGTTTTIHEIESGCAGLTCDLTVGEISPSLIQSMAVDGNKNIYAVDGASQTAFEYPWNSYGNYYEPRIRIGYGEAEPFSVAVDTNGIVYITDTANYRVLRVDRGQTLEIGLSARQAPGSRRPSYSISLGPSAQFWCRP